MVGPRRSWPNPPGPHDGDRNGEPAELDWGCVAMVIAVLCIVMVIGMLVLASSFPADRVYSSTVRIVCAPS